MESNCAGKCCRAYVYKERLRRQKNNATSKADDYFRFNVFFAHAVTTGKSCTT